MADASFGTNGSVIVDVGDDHYSFAYAATLQADGRILVAGSAETDNGYNDFAVLRFLSDKSSGADVPEQDATNMLVYPNPATAGGLLLVKLPFSKDDPVSFELTDMTGRLVQTFDFSNKNSKDNAYMLPVAAIPAGIYRLTAKAGVAVLGCENIALK